jgi:hypothetical protein
VLPLAMGGVSDADRSRSAEAREVIERLLRLGR